jgi:hypothetical protein
MRVPVRRWTISNYAGKRKCLLSPENDDSGTWGNCGDLRGKLLLLSLVKLGLLLRVQNINCKCLKTKGKGTTLTLSKGLVSG